MKLTTKHNISSWLIFISMISIHQSLAQCHIDDWTALKAFYESTNGDNWIDNSGWDVYIKDNNEPPQNCNLGELYGVRIQNIPDYRITRIQMVDNNLQGVIPPEIDKLNKLERIDLRFNQISGNIPPQISNLSSLSSLDLYDNQLSGNLPKELGNLNSLEYLSLGNNQISGNIPPELGNLSSLIRLSLYNNRIIGNIPPELGNLINLSSLSLSNNRISGSVPPELSNLDNLYILDLTNNRFNGSIPVGLSNLSKLEYLHLNNNQISGNIPAELGNLSILKGLYLGNNRLSGSIPVELENLSELQVLSVNNNELSGNIPAVLGNLSKLQNLNLQHNKLSGTIPIELGNLSRLESLNLNNNELSGTIPIEFGNLKFKYLKLNDNKLSGVIPVELANNQFLEELKLQNNELSGSIPDELGNLVRLHNLALHNNNLTGNIPESLGNPINFWDLDRQLSLYNNQLNGCYHPNLAALCYIKNDKISYGNNFDASWDDFCSAANGVCSIEGEAIFGCSDREACNYNPNANYENVSCTYESLDAGCRCNSQPGCTNANAINYNASAGCLDFSCNYAYNSLEPNEYDYVFCKDVVLYIGLKQKCSSDNFMITENTINENVTIDDDGLLQITKPVTNGIVKVASSSSNNCNAEWTFNITISSNDNCTEVYEGDQMFFQFTWLSSILNPKDCQGTEVSLYSTSYSDEIYVKNNDGGTLYDWYGNTLCFDYPKGEGYCLESRSDITYINSWTCTKFIPVEGCTDPLACNFLSAATNEDGTCTYTNCISPLIECPKNYETSICAPVSLPPSLNLPDFNTTDDPNLLNSLSLQVDEQTDIQQYFTTTTRNYTIADDTGNQKTCETKYHVANQFLQAPEVSPPGIICEEDLWSSIKIGVDQYKIYSDFFGLVEDELSICNTSNLICSTADFGVDTNIPDTHSFWATTYFKFPDGTICESAASSFSVEVHPKPDAELYKQFERVDKGEVLVLMDLVKNNTSGYWSGEDIYYVATVSGENIVYFSANTEGYKKLYYSVKNEWCERSYLLLVYVGNINGCTDDNALNYDVDANVNDGSCTYAPANDFDFAEYPWLNEVANPIDCAQKLMVTSYELESDTLVYVSSVNGGLLYNNKGNLYCEDANGKDCLTEYALVSLPTKGWSCFGGSFNKYDYIYTICEGEYANLVADYYSYIIPCFCPICAPVGPPAPPAVTWSPEAACDWVFCTSVAVSPTVTTSYQSNAESVNASSSVCSSDDGGPDGAPDPGNTITNFLVVVEQCAPAKTITFNQAPKKINPSFYIYPNPTSHKVFIDLPDEAVYQINFTDISGKMMKQMETELDATTVEINVDNLPKGMYLVELKNEVSSSIQKLIIE